MAIKPEELRIGNWVKFVTAPVKMSAINWEEWGELRPYFEYSSWPYYTSTFENLHPIPLTPEILVACGFHKDNYDLFEFVRDNKPYISGCDILLWCKETERGIWNFCIGKDLSSLSELCDLKHLHQLMNLYHSLTSKELTYKT